MDIVVGTLILWGLLALFVQPLANHWLRRRLQEPAYFHLNSAEELDEQASQELASLAARYFILASVVVLGIAGFVLGLAIGAPFIGFAWKRQFWPGMIALIIASFVGAGFAA